MTWRTVELREVCKVVGGGTPSSGVSQYWGGDIIWVTPTDLGRNEGVFIASSARKISREGYESCGAEMLPPGAVVMSSRAPIGHLAIAQSVLCTNQGCKSFICSETLDSMFLYFALRFSMSQVRELGSGATFSEVSKSQLEKFQISIPTLSEQKRIAAMLNEQMVSAKHAADVANAQSELVARLPRAFLSKRFKSSDIASAPKKRVRDLCRAMSGGTPAKDREDYWGGPIPWITVKDMKARTVETVNLTITEKAVAETATHLAPTGAVLVLVRGMGLANGLPICEIRRPSAFNQDIKGLISLGEVTPAYLAWGLRAQASEILGDRQTVTHGTLKLGTESLLDVDIPVPSLDIQERLSRQLSDDFVLVDQVAGRLGEIKSEVAELPATLLRQAFSGRI